MLRWLSGRGVKDALFLHDEDNGSGECFGCYFGNPCSPTLEINDDDFVVAILS